MNIITKISTYLQTQDDAKVRQFIILFFGSLCFFTFGLQYYLYHKKNTLIAHIKQLRILTDKSVTLITESRIMNKEEARIKAALDNKKDFTIQGFFEQLCKDHNLIPEAGWDTRSIDINEHCVETLLHATFKDQTTQAIVNLLEILEKNDIVYIKELEIHTDKPTKINLDITFASKRYKDLD